MSDLLKTLSAVALLALSAPAWAQEADGQADTGDQPAASSDVSAPDAGATDAQPAPQEGDDASAPQDGDGEEASAGEERPDVVEPTGTDGLSMGEPDSGSDGQSGGEGTGSSYVAESFEDWEQRCVRTEDGSDPCQLYQLLRDSEGNAVAEMSVFPLPPGREAAAGATIITPLETLLTRNIRLSVDGGQAKRYPFDFCAQQGCFARIGLTAAEVQQLKRGAEAQLTIVPAAAPDQQIDLGISLAGFTAGFDATTEANAQ